MLCTWPDICFAIGLVSRYQSNTGLAHWQGVKRIMRNLRGATDLVLCYQGGDLNLRGYSDANCGGDSNESKSTSGYVFTLDGGAISWCSRKQDCIAVSTMEVEYVICSLAMQEAIWLRSYSKILTSFLKLMIMWRCYVTTQPPSSLLNIRRFIERPSISRGVITSCETP